MAFGVTIHVQDFQSGPALSLRLPTDSMTTFVISIYPYDNQRVLVGTFDMIIAEINRQTGTLNDTYSDYLSMPGLSNLYFRTYSFLEDSLGNLWLGTKDGIYRFSRDTISMHYQPLQNLVQDHNVDSNRVVYEAKNNWLRADLFSADGKKLYLGTRKGDGLLVHHLEKDSFWFVRYQSGPKYEQTDIWIDDLCEDATGRLWIGSENGLLYFDNGAQRIYKKELGLDLIDNGHLVSLALRDSFLYLGTSGNGLFRMNLLNGRITDFPSGDQQLFAQTDIHKLFFDRDGSLWIATNSGLFIYRPDQGTFLGYKEYPGGGKWLDEIDAYDIVQLESGPIFISSRGDGLLCYDPGKKLWRSFKSNNYESYNFQGELAVTPDQKIIISTNFALLTFDYQLPYEDYPAFQGFSTSTGLERSLLAFPDGRIWAGANKGFYELRLPQVESQYASLDLYIKNILVSGKSYADLFEVRQEKKIVLSYSDNSFSIEPGAINFALRGRNYFFQKLEEVDPDWVQVSPTNTITYSNLPPGQYRFLYRVSDQSGRWSEQIGELTIIIRPPWWRSNWTYVGYACLALMLLFFARRQIIQREQLKSRLELEQLEKEKMQEIDQLRARFFANISHEFRTPLTLIKAPLEDLLTSKRTHEERVTFLQMHQNTERLLSLVNQLLDPIPPGIRYFTNTIKSHRYLFFSASISG